MMQTVIKKLFWCIYGMFIFGGVGILISVPVAAVFEILSLDLMTAFYLIVPSACVYGSIYGIRRSNDFY